MTTDEISGKPRVPVGELREKVEEWKEVEDAWADEGVEDDGNWGRAITYRRCRRSIEALIERYDYE